jgi:ribosomal protein L40E
MVTSMKGLTDSEYRACMDNLGLLEGEKKELEYLIEGVIIGRGDGSELEHLFQGFINGSIDSSKTKTLKKGLLVFTDINLIFIQQEDYLRLVVPLDQLGGMGCFIHKDHYAIGVVTVDGYKYGFDLCRTEDSSFIQNPSPNELSKQIQKFGMEQKRLAKEAPVKICKYCSARNKIDQSRCVNCGALLT